MANSIIIQAGLNEAYLTHAFSLQGISQPSCTYEHQTAFKH